MKRLIVCCDGTWNTPDQTDGGVPAPTNVVKLYNCVTEGDVGGVEQVKYYHPGVGTDPGLLSRAAGGGLGLGLDRNIMSAYRFVAENYAPGDEIYLFGFSRGAYTVRSLGGMIGRCGLLATDGLDEATVWSGVQDLFDNVYRKQATPKRQGWKFRPLPDGATKIPIRFLGVWDTVGALGIPDDMALLNLLDGFRDRSFHDTDLGTGVQTARHAVAIDERRASFQPTLWTNVGADRDVRQLWFPGVHSDVGGGYADTGLSDAALQWMIEEAGGVGLTFEGNLVAQIVPRHHGTLHDSLTGPFALLPTKPRCAPCLANGADLHGSATDRYRNPPINQAPYRRTRILERGKPVPLDVFAADPWNDTGLYLEAGVTYEMTATGEWLDKSIPTGPAGSNDGNFHVGELVHLVGSAIGQAETLFKYLTKNESADFIMTKRHEKLPWFCLVGAVANGTGVDPHGKPIPHETKEIGNGCTWTPEKSGYLYAYANDAWRFYGNNKGRVRLTVTRL